MRRKDWRTNSAASAARPRARHPDTAVRLLLLGERAVRWLVAVALVTGTTALCAVALIGPEALTLHQQDALPQMLGRLRDALSGMLG